MVVYFMLLYYSFGIFCLPKGDFSVLAGLHEMYAHCKQTEDKDMTPFDFITDHLLNIDGLFDAHAEGDEQKPHQSIHLHSYLTFISPVLMQETDYKIHLQPISCKPLITVENNFIDTYFANIFRPPSFC